MKKPITILVSIFLATTLFAHEYVLIAYNFFVKEGEKIELHLFVADGFNIQIERPIQKSITKKFEMFNENGTTNLLKNTTEGDLPILEMNVNFKGLGLIHMERDYAQITLPNEEFTDYLKVDNIENITIDSKNKQNQTERYTRYLKTLIQSNPKKNDDIYKTVVGQNFEIVLLKNPYTLNEGDWISAKVLFMGEPLQNKVITARNRNGNESSIYQFSRTDDEGICSFKLEREGDWFLHATHMIPAPDKVDADWESFWTTFSFGIRNND
ncbi:MAG: DUF4198 domain-containing protein [Lutibacter sp.]|uniref:DUF4198 domain-containing protein n=1 Tax=Lutibacter sp. TaxID=1925666 RepID=UPI0017E61998|nr:DUF4198 domain-containing protein [Lutibacter sp.]MBT8317875.1 DUF4198 domain-containing protein [Lutibacter sp.]NNJ58733.1 DUF4198 domain-containing protein [Lutibacter sp.]